MKLYNYTSKKYGLQSLLNQRLKVSNLSDLNDPFELYSINLSSSSLREYFKNFKKKTADEMRLLCFSETRTNPLMWGHYADKHSGVVLEFHVNDEIVNKVQYQKNRQQFDTKLHEAGFDFKIFTTKFLDWSYEKEQRVFLDKDEVTREGILDFYSFSDEIKLVGLYAGPLCKITTNEVANNLPKNTSIRFARTRLAFKSYNVVRNLSFSSKIVKGKVNTAELP